MSRFPKRKMATQSGWIQTYGSQTYCGNLSHWSKINTDLHITRTVQHANPSHFEAMQSDRRNALTPPSTPIHPPAPPTVRLETLRDCRVARFGPPAPLSTCTPTAPPQPYVCRPRGAVALRALGPPGPPNRTFADLGTHPQPQATSPTQQQNHIASTGRPPTVRLQTTNRTFGERAD